tara:strand:+ start:5038 stop:5586 length:549 start_codon:yes stop_codon:yes gene_type:complete
MLLIVCFGFAGSSAPDVVKPGMVQVHGGTLFWSVVTFLLLLVVLKKVAWIPIIEALENRESEIKNALSSAEKARENAEKASKDYDDLVKKARLEAQEIITESKSTGERIRTEIKETAEKEAHEIIEKAQNQINAEREKAINDIKKIVVDFSIQAASKIIEKNLDSDDNRRIVNDTIEGIGKA